MLSVTPCHATPLPPSPTHAFCHTLSRNTTPTITYPCFPSHPVTPCHCNTTPTITYPCFLTPCHVTPLPPSPTHAFCHTLSPTHAFLTPCLPMLSVTPCHVTPLPPSPTHAFHTLSPTHAFRHTLSHNHSHHHLPMLSVWKPCCGSRKQVRTFCPVLSS